MGRAPFKDFDASDSSNVRLSPHGERVLSRWSGAANDRTLTPARPFDRGGVYTPRPPGESREQTQDRVHKHVVRRLIKAGIAARDGAGGLARGPRWDEYAKVHQHLFPGKGSPRSAPQGQSFYRAHDLQHAVLGARGDWPAEQSILHMDHITGHLHDVGHISPSTMKQLPRLANVYYPPGDPRR